MPGSTVDPGIGRAASASTVPRRRTRPADQVVGLARRLLGLAAHRVGGRLGATAYALRRRLRLVHRGTERALRRVRHGTGTADRPIAHRLVADSAILVPLGAV